MRKLALLPLLALAAGLAAYACSEASPAEPEATQPMAIPVAASVTDDAGNGEVIHACYVPTSGNMYRIKEEDLKQECSAPNHVEFSFSVQGPKGDKGDKGDTGDKGDPGPPGPPGVSGYEWRYGRFMVSPRSQSGTNVGCQGGKRAVAAGWDIDGCPECTVFTNRPEPPSDPIGWSFSAGNPSANFHMVNVWTLCVSAN